jgi:hypothetical protein
LQFAYRVKLFGPSRIFPVVFLIFLRYELIQKIDKVIEKESKKDEIIGKQFIFNFENIRKLKQIR